MPLQPDQLRRRQLCRTAVNANPTRRVAQSVSFYTGCPHDSEGRQIGGLLGWWRSLTYRAQSAKEAARKEARGPACS